MMLDKKLQQKIKKREHWSNETVVRFYKKSSTLPHVVCANKSKNGLGFEIRPSMTSQRHPNFYLIANPAVDREATTHM